MFSHRNKLNIIKKLENGVKCLYIFSIDKNICMLTNRRTWNDFLFKQKLQIILQDIRIILRDNIKYTRFVTKIQCLLYIYNIQLIMEI